MADWKFTRVAGIGGRHRIVVTRPGRYMRDITFLRGAPVGLPSYSDADPFGDALANLSFPQVSALDDLTSPELDWLRADTLVDIWWVPGVVKPSDWQVTQETSDTHLALNPLNNKLEVLTTLWDYTRGTDGNYVRDLTSLRAGVQKVWEGHIVEVDSSSDGSSSSLTASCAGALFEIDSILAKPFFPPRPQTLESLILSEFSHTRRPSLHTHPPYIEWPAGWTFTAPPFTGSNTEFDPNVKPGAKWTGYTTRQTGAWDHSLTSYIQNMLAVMLVKQNSGVPSGDQWTLQLAHQGDPTYPKGRTPVLRVRSRRRAPDFSLWCTSPGVKHNLKNDATQAAQAVYGTGTDVAGTNWNNSVVAANGSRTDYRPLAASPAVYPVVENPRLDRNRMLRETYVQYGTGFSQLSAIQSAEHTLQRDQDPGWSGTITLEVDPSSTMSRWAVRAGMTVNLLGFIGTGAAGVRFHIASTEKNVEDGSVTLTVDTRYRDLATLEEALARSRDALTPAKLLQLNRNSVTIEDIQAPWNYSGGSGYVPRASLGFYRNKPTSELFPYRNWLLAHPPRKFPSWYVHIPADATATRRKWAGPITVLMAEKGSIRRSEFVVVNHYGQILPIPYHVSLYYNNGVNATFMPTDGRSTSPFIPNAFESIDPTTGSPWAQPGHEADQSMVIGWGNKEQPAGYSPGLKSKGAHPTGLLVDESTWTWDCSASNPNYDHLAKAGKEASSVISLYLMAYASYSEPVYLIGRLYRQEPGTV